MWCGTRTAMATTSPDSASRVQSTLSRVDLLLLFLAAWIPRAIVAAIRPEGGGDWGFSYLPVALNILHNGCISLSDPATALCEPSWGGNQAPGFSAFVALVWWLLPETQLVLVQVQAVVVSAAILAVAAMAARLGSNRMAGLVVGLALAFSPQHLAWTRFSSTDPLTITFSLLLIAALMHGLDRQRLPIWPVALALIGALAVRFDSVLLTIPVALAGFLLHAPMTAIRRGVAIILILMVPAGLWTVRNVAQELTILPPQFFSPKFERPPGFNHWGYTWTMIEYQYPSWYYDAVQGRYDLIAVDPANYRTREEREDSEAAITRLQAYVGQDIPRDIDEEFARIADKRRAIDPLRQWVISPAIRARNLWFNPFNPTAWPYEMSADVLFKVRAGALWELREGFEKEPGPATLALALGMERLLLLGLFAWVFAMTLGRRHRGPWRQFVWLAASYLVGRTLFFAYFPLVETRYIMPVTPWLEVVIALGLMVRFRPQWATGLTLLRPPCRDS
jgi:hypothetical protein